MVIFEIRKFTKMAKLIHFKAKRCQKHRLYRKRVQIKVPKHLILYKKVSGRICLSPIGGDQFQINNNIQDSGYQKIILVKCRFLYNVTFELLLVLESIVYIVEAVRQHYGANGS